VNWDAVGAIGELIGAAVVIVTLVYLSLQIRQNTIAQQTTSVWMLTQLFNQTHTSILENPEVAGLLARALQEKLEDPVDRVRINSIVKQMVNAYAAVWRAHQTGHLADEVFEEMVADSEILTAPGMIDALKRDLLSRNPNFIAEFFPQFSSANNKRAK